MAVWCVNVCFMILQLKPSLDKEKDPMAGIMDLMKVWLKPIQSLILSSKLFYWSSYTNSNIDHSFTEYV